jgi:hypothetical protein
MGQVVMERIKVDIDDIANVEQQSKLEGKQMTMMLAPDSKKIAIYLTKQKKKASEKNELEKEQDQNQ